MEDYIGEPTDGLPIWRHGFATGTAFGCIATIFMTAILMMVVGKIACS